MNEIGAQAPFLIQNQHMKLRTPFILLAIIVSTPLLLGGLFVVPTFGATPPPVTEGRVSDADISSITTGALSVAGAQPVREIVSEIITTPFVFTGILARWRDELTISDDTTLELRFMEHGSWSAWIQLDPLRDAPTGAVAHGTVSEPHFVNNAEQFQYRFVDAVADISLEAFRDIEFVYIDSSTPERPVGWLRRIFQANRAQAEPTLQIISRSEWGADESYRFSGDRERWPPTYAPAEKIILHHTAGSNGGTDPAAVVRGIYYFHASVLGWGDIGYNYLIDPAGTIYEGRYGGDGVVGGHTYNDAEGIDYNRGTIGIAVLGNYQSETLSPETQESVTALMSEKAYLFSLAPGGSSDFRTRTNLANVIGHGDVDATACPGVNIKSRIEIVRTEAQTRFAALAPMPLAQVTAQQVGEPVVTTSADAGTTATVTFTYTNTGNTPWQSYLPTRRVVLKPLVTPSALAAASWIAPEIAATTANANVPIGGPATFTFAVTAPTATFTAQEAFALFGPDGVEVPNSRVRVAVQSQNHDYAGVIDRIPIAPASFLGKDQTVAVRVQNAGRNPWLPGEVVLTVSDLDGRPSRYRARSWANDFGRFPINETVAPGGTATVSVRMRAPQTPGLYLNVFHLARADGAVMVVNDQRSISRVDSPWNAELVERRFPTAVRSSSKATLTVKYKNTGITTWTRTTVALRVYDVGFRPSRFAHPTWRWNTSQFRLQEARVRPGDTGTFAVRLQSPSQMGLYRQVLRLETLKTNVVIDNAVSDFLTRVDSR